MAAYTFAYELGSFPVGPQDLVCETDALALYSGKRVIQGFCTCCVWAAGALLCGLLCCCELCSGGRLPAQRGFFVALVNKKTQDWAGWCEDNRWGDGAGASIRAFDQNVNLVKQMVLLEGSEVLTEKTYWAKLKLFGVHEASVIVRDALQELGPLLERLVPTGAAVVVLGAQQPRAAQMK